MHPALPASLEGLHALHLAEHLDAQSIQAALLLIPNPLAFDLSGPLSCKQPFGRQTHQSIRDGDRIQHARIYQSRVARMTCHQSSSPRSRASGRRLLALTHILCALQQVIELNSAVSANHAIGQLDSPQFCFVPARRWHKVVLTHGEMRRCRRRFSVYGKPTGMSKPQASAHSSSIGRM